MNRIHLLVLMLIINTAIIAQGFVEVSANNLSIDKKFNSVLNSANDDIFIGYSITTNTENMVTIGSYFIDDKEHGFCLRDMINNPNKYNREFAENPKENNINQNRHIFRIIMNSSKNDFEPDSETAIIFHLSKDENNVDEFNDITICNLALNVDFGSDRLYWLGNIDNSKSANYLIKLFESTSDNERKEELISAIGMHKNQQQVLSLLIDIATDKSNNELREESFYWLAYQDNIEAFNTLKKILYSNESMDMREEALMGIAQMNIDESLNEIINIAKHSKDRQLREEAIMWLGEKAVKKASEELRGFIENDPEIDIIKNALYALSEHSGDNIPYFINLAKNHNSLTIRKNAIYILSESEDKRATDVLINLASGNN